MAGIHTYPLGVRGKRMHYCMRQFTLKSMMKSEDVSMDIRCLLPLYFASNGALK